MLVPIDLIKAMEQLKSNCESSTYKRTSLKEKVSKLQSRFNQSKEGDDFWKFKAGKLSNLQKEIETHGTLSILVDKIIDLHKTLTGKEKDLEEENDFSMVSLSQMVFSQKDLKEEQKSCHGWMKEYNNAIDKGIQDDQTAFQRDIYSGKFMTIELWINSTSIKPESPPHFYCFQRKKGKSTNKTQR